MHKSLPRTALLFVPLFVLLSAAPVQGQTNPNYTLGADPHLAAGAGGHGTKLTAGASVVIQAPVANGLPGNPGQPGGNCIVGGVNVCACYSILNKTNQNNAPGISYFVPWNKPNEWSSFLDAVGATAQLQYQQSHSQPYPVDGSQPQPPPGGWIKNVSIYNGCCAPTTVTQATANLRCPITSSAAVGYQYLGLTTGSDVPYWGAEKDVYGPISDSTSGSDYQVTLVCSNGAWVVSRKEGNCVPTAGQCATGMQGITTLPSDYTQLCASTSVFAGFTNPGGASAPSGWTWTCLGTPGQPAASCSSNIGTDGQCGSDANQTQDGWGYWTFAYWPAPSPNLCANGTTAGNISVVPDLNSWNNPGTTYLPNLYHWTCSGIGGSNVTAQCSAPDGDGYCGSANNTSGSAQPDPAVDFLCAIGKPSAVTYGWNAWPGTPQWQWTCSNDPSGPFSSNGYCHENDIAAPQPGVCGWSDTRTSGSIWYSDTAPPSSNLCDTSYGAVPSVLASGPTFALGSTSVWTWTCQGANNGSIASCYETYDPFPGVCGPASANWDPADTPPSSGLCSSGTPDTPWNYAGKWNWGCWSGSGNKTPCSDGGVYTVGQCGAANGVSSLTTPATNLCEVGPASVVSNSGGTWTWQCGPWPHYDYCSAPIGGGSAGTCGTANGGSFSTVPYIGLCGSGSPTAVADSGNGQWVWQCTSAAGTANCSATDTAAGPGICGATNNTAVPNAPNTNLCASGAASPVTGAGPWNWTCFGEGPNIGQDANCQANICQACTGSIAVGYTAGVSTGTVSPSLCTVRGQASWLENDGVTPSNAPVTLSWNDPFYGTFTRAVTPEAAPSNYCQPCYLSMQGVSSALVTVQAVTGSCPADANLNSGNPVVYTPTNIQIHRCAPLNRKTRSRKQDDRRHDRRCRQPQIRRGTPGWSTSSPALGRSGSTSPGRVAPASGTPSVKSLWPQSAASFPVSSRTRLNSGLNVTLRRYGARSNNESTWLNDFTSFIDLNRLTVSGLPRQFGRGWQGRVYYLSRLLQ